MNIFGCFHQRMYNSNNETYFNISTTKDLHCVAAVIRVGVGITVLHTVLCTSSVQLSDFDYYKLSLLQHTCDLSVCRGHSNTKYISVIHVLHAYNI